VMKRILYLAAVTVVAMLILVPSAFAAAQGTAVIEQTVEMEQTILQPTGGPSIGGAPAVILPAAAALLLGSGVLTYAVLRRRR
jgi:hypothetical protein